MEQTGLLPAPGLSLQAVVRAFQVPGAFPSSSPLFALETRRNQQGLVLAAFLEYLLEGGEVYCLDAGNCFDPYPLALAARTIGRLPEEVLERVFVSRAATCHQVVSVVEELLLPLGREPARKVVAVLGINTLFSDEDIPLFERRYLFNRTLQGIASIRSAGIGCIVTYSPQAREQRTNPNWAVLLQRTLQPSRLKEDSIHGQNHSHLYPLS
jgi:hypothetical protein